MFETVTPGPNNTFCTSCPGDMELVVSCDQTHAGKKRNMKNQPLITLKRKKNRFVVATLTNNEPISDFTDSMVKISK